MLEWIRKSEYFRTLVYLNIDLSNYVLIFFCYPKMFHKFIYMWLCCLDAILVLQSENDIQITLQIHNFNERSSHVLYQNKKKTKKAPNNLALY